MNDITRTIIGASQEPVTSVESTIDELYEETDISDVEREVIKVAATMEPEELQVQKQDPNIDDDGYYDPYPKTKHQSAEAAMQDRLLTIPRRPSLKIAPWGSLWVIHTGFIEQIALLNITKSEQRSLLRQWADIQVMAESEGLANVVESEQDEFMLKIVSYKSRSDNPEKGIRERTAHITQKSIADQNIVMPRGEQQRSGFLNTILGRNKVQQQ